VPFGGTIEGVWVTQSLSNVLTPTAVALGNFDGIHQGHRQVIQPILKWPSAYPTVLTFYPHPKAFFSGQPLSLLTPLDEKVAQLREMGVKQLVLLPFNQELAQLSPEAFVDTVLLQGVQAQKISVGQDFCFGRGRAGTAERLGELVAAAGVEVEIAPLKQQDGDRISSSAIRQSLQTGAIEQANRLLGRLYSLVGEVVSGQRLGRSLGFPTANLQLPPEKFLPRLGVYAVQVRVCPKRDELPNPEQAPLPGVMNLGNRPTVNGTQLVAEVHLLNWQGDLYGSLLKVDLCAFLRPEQRFDSLAALTTQIERDCAQAQAIFGGDLGPGCFD
jgi:riboflavin kinase / FMN adenylyltransferase